MLFIREKKLNRDRILISKENIIESNIRKKLFCQVTNYLIFQLFICHILALINEVNRWKRRCG